MNRTRSAIGLVLLFGMAVLLASSTDNSANAGPVTACGPAVAQPVPVCQPAKPLPPPAVCGPAKPLPPPAVCEPAKAGIAAKGAAFHHAVHEHVINAVWRVKLALGHGYHTTVYANPQPASPSKAAPGPVPAPPSPPAPPVPVEKT
ncbi:MAG: hypothetical protein ACLQNE_34820 [Thermoguttaceae bacterium]